MRRKNILKLAGVLLIAAILVLTSVVIVPMTVAQIPGHVVGVTGIISRTRESSQTPSMGRGPVIFSQRPSTPNESWTFWASDLNAGYLCIDDFWNLTDDICDIHWYGLYGIFSGGWVNGDPTGVLFDINIYVDSGGAPGTPFATYENLEPTPHFYQSYENFTCYYWEIDISCINLSNGWISIQSTYCPDGSWFYWANSPEGNFNAMQNGGNINDNLAFNLTTEIPCCFDITFIPYDQIKPHARLKMHITELCNESHTNVPWSLTIINNGPGPLRCCLPFAPPLNIGDSRTYSYVISTFPAGSSKDVYSGLIWAAIYYPPFVKEARSITIIVTVDGCSAVTQYAMVGWWSILYLKL